MTSEAKLQVQPGGMQIQIKVQVILKQCLFTKELQVLSCGLTEKA